MAPFPLVLKPRNVPMLQSDSDHGFPASRYRKDDTLTSNDGWYRFALFDEKGPTYLPGTLPLDSRLIDLTKNTAYGGPVWDDEKKKEDDDPHPVFDKRLLSISGYVHKKQPRGEEFWLNVTISYRCKEKLGKVGYIWYTRRFWVKYEEYKAKFANLIRTSRPLRFSNDDSLLTGFVNHDIVDFDPSDPDEVTPDLRVDYHKAADPVKWPGFSTLFSSTCPDDQTIACFRDRATDDDDPNIRIFPQPKTTRPLHGGLISPTWFDQDHVKVIVSKVVGVAAFKRAERRGELAK